MSLSRKLTICGVLITSLLSFNSAVAGHLNPAEKGRHNVGYLSMEVELTPGISTTANVWYPVARGSSYLPATTYEALISFPFGTEAIGLESTLGAVQNAPIKRGVYPLVIQTHGCCAVQAGNINGLAHTRALELLASHGIVAVSFTRRDQSLRSSMNIMIDAVTSALPGSIDENKIGIAGESFGARDSLSYGAGVSLPQFGFELPADPRVKAILVQDAPLPATTSEVQLAEMSIPFMLISGSLFTSPATQTLFDNAVGSPEKYHVRMNTASHLSFSSSSCDLLDSARSQAVMNEINAGLSPLQDPIATPLPPFVPGGSVTAVYAFLGWNFISSSGILELGQASEYCREVGVNDPLLSSDLDADGLADSYTGLNAEGEPVLSHEQINQVQISTANAFWMVHLAGDKRYKRFIKQKAGKGNPDFDIEVVNNRAKKCDRNSNKRSQKFKSSKSSKHHASRKSKSSKSSKHYASRKHSCK